MFTLNINSSLRITDAQSTQENMYTTNVAWVTPCTCTSIQYTWPKINYILRKRMKQLYRRQSFLSKYICSDISWKEKYDPVVHSRFRSKEKNNDIFHLLISDQSCQKLTYQNDDVVAVYGCSKARETRVL